MIRRQHHLTELRRRLKQFPVVAIIGARQVGKTTLAREVAREFKGATRYFDLEHAEDFAVLREPLLRELRGVLNLLKECLHVGIRP